MSHEQLWALVGLVIGWALTTATSLVASTASHFIANRRSTGRLLAKLLEVRSHVQTLASVSETLKDVASGWSEYERIRKYVANKHFLDGGLDADNLEAITNDLAGIRPLAAVRIRELFRLLAKAKQANFEESSKFEEIYIRVLSAHEVSLESLASALDKVVHKLAWVHSPITWVRVRISSYQASRRRAHFEPFAGEFVKEIREAMGSEEKPRA